MKFPAILTAKKKISSTVVKQEVFSRISQLTKNDSISNKRVLLLTEQNLNSVYWIYALYYSGFQFAIASAESTAEEINYFKKTIGDCIVLNKNKFKYRKNTKKILDCSKKSKIILFTSGTSGKPKGIALNKTNFLNHALAYQKHFQLEKSTTKTWLCNLPLHHISGLSILMRSLCLNYDFAFEPKYSSSSFKMWINSGKIVGASIVPTILFRMLNEYKKIYFHKNFSYLLVGGAALPIAVKEKVLHFTPHWPIYTTYGSTETCSQIATSSPNDPLKKRLEELLLLDSINVKIAKSNELIISSPSLRKESIQNGSFIKEPNKYPTGDLGKWIKKNSRLKIIGRKSDIIISGGVNIFPQDIEAAISKINLVKDCVVLGIPDQEWGEKAIVYYTTKSKKPIMPILFTKKLREQLSPKKIPKNFFFLKSIPLTRNGKVDKMKLKAKLLPGHSQ